jgi:hypothetical protein
MHAGWGRAGEAEWGLLGVLGVGRWVWAEWAIVQWRTGLGVLHRRKEAREAGGGGDKGVDEATGGGRVLESRVWGFMARPWHAGWGHAAWGSRVGARVGAVEAGFRNVALWGEGMHGVGVPLLWQQGLDVFKFCATAWVGKRGARVTKQGRALGRWPGDGASVRAAGGARGLSWSWRDEVCVLESELPIGALAIVRMLHVCCHNGHWREGRPSWSPDPRLRTRI